MSEPVRHPRLAAPSDRITTSGRLLPDDPARLAAIGVKRIVNLALDTHPEALADEANLCAALGLGYTHLPIPFDTPREAHFEAFRAVIGSDDTPVHVHCIANWRVSACFYRYNRDIMGMTEQEARTLMAQQWGAGDVGLSGSGRLGRLHRRRKADKRTKRRTAMTDFAGRHVHRHGRVERHWPGDRQAPGRARRPRFHARAPRRGAGRACRRAGQRRMPPRLRPTSATGRSSRTQSRQPCTNMAPPMACSPMLAWPAISRPPPIIRQTCSRRSSRSI